MTSKKWNLIKQDFIKIGKGFLIAISGAVIAFLLDVSEIIDFSQYGTMAPYIALASASICSTLANAIVKWVKNNEYSDVE